MTTKTIDMGGWFKTVSDTPVKQVTQQSVKSAPMTVERARKVLDNFKALEEKKRMEQKQSYYNSPEFLKIILDEYSKIKTNNGGV